MNRGRRNILRNLLGGGASLWDLAAEYPGRLRYLCLDLRELVKEGHVVSTSLGFALTPSGRDEAREAGLVERKRVVCPVCLGRGVSGHSVFDEAFREFKEIAESRPRAVAEYDQGYVEQQISLDRCLLMYERGDLEGAHVFLLGDDDLTSICLALTGLPRTVTVTEIDERLIDFISGIAAKRNLPISALRYDAREDLPGDLKGVHDVFLTDPVETLPGIGLFLSRCAQSLSGAGTAGYFGLTHLEASRRKWAAIQKMILDMNFIVTDALPFFNRYILEDDEYFTGRLLDDFPVRLESPVRNWYNSTFFRVEAVDAPLTLYHGDCDMGEELYLDDDLKDFHPGA